MVWVEKRGPRHDSQEVVKSFTSVVDNCDFRCTEKDGPGRVPDWYGYMDSSFCAFGHNWLFPYGRGMR
jgi:hypothetical protein